MQKSFVFVTRLFILFMALTVTLQARTIVRMATLAPRGSDWHVLLQEMGAKWQKVSGGEVVLRIYPGGVTGDESESIRKMRIGQLQSTAISGSGLAEIDRSAYALMIPGMFETYEEWDYVRNQINPDIERNLEEKGFVVLVWFDVGWVHFFSKEALKEPSDLKRMKLAASASESATVEIMKSAGFNPVPITTADMITGLQTGLIDAFYLPIIFAADSNLYRYAQNMTGLKWVPLQGAIVIRSEDWATISPEHQKRLLEISNGTGDKLRKETREREDASLEAMKARGLKVWDVDEDSVLKWQQAAEQAYPLIKEKLVPAPVFEKVQRLRDEFRARGRSDGPGTSDK